MMNDFIIMMKKNGRGLFALLASEAVDKSGANFKSFLIQFSNENFDEIIFFFLFDKKVEKYFYRCLDYKPR